MHSGALSSPCGMNKRKGDGRGGERTKRSICWVWSVDAWMCVPGRASAYVAHHARTSPQAHSAHRQVKRKGGGRGGERTKRSICWVWRSICWVWSVDAWMCVSGRASAYVAHHARTSPQAHSAHRQVTAPGIHLRAGCGHPHAYLAQTTNLRGRAIHIRHSRARPRGPRGTPCYFRARYF